MLTQEELDALDAQPLPETEQLPGTGAAAPRVNAYINSGAEAIPDPDAPDDLDQYLGEQAEQAQIEPEEVPAPTPVAAAPTSKYAPTQILAQTQGQEAKLASTKPNWYDDLAPPEIKAGDRAAAGLFGGLLSAFGAKSAKEGFGNFLGGVGAAAEGAMSAPQDNYKNRLKAASEQADMHAKLSSGGGSALGVANLDLAERKFQHLLDKEGTAAATEKALKTIGSPESNELADSYISAGIYKPEDKARLSGWQMRAARVGAQQQSGSERQAANQKTNFNMRQDAKGEWHQIERSDKMEDRQLDRDEKMEDRDLDKQKDVEQAYIPGRKWLKGRPPMGQQVSDARTVAVAGNNAVAIARHLAELQDKVSNPLVQAGGVGWNNAFGNVDQAQLLADMNAERGELEAAIRILRGQGAPQPWELAANAATNPEADSVFTFFKGKTSWDGLARQLERTTDRKLRYFGSVPDDGDAHNAPVPASAPRDKPATINTKKAIQDSVGGIANKAEKVGELVDTAKQAAPAAAKTIAIQVLDPVTKTWGAAREVTREQYREAMKKLAERNLPLDHIRKAQ